MGIVNVTPDSFSDGGKFLDPDQAVDHALALAAAGAEILDIGGESTRPGAYSVSEAEELRRVLPVIERLASQTKVPLSIDTIKPAIARAALNAGVSIVNDVGAHSPARAAGDGMWQTIAETGAGYICMHAQGTPQTMQIQPAYTNVVDEVGRFFQNQLQHLQAQGIDPARVALDPGIGFGKALEHNLLLLAHLRNFTTYQRPLLIGVSRKSFLGKITGADVNARLPASLACAILAVASGAQIIRTHDVTETIQALRTAEAIEAARTT